MSSEHATESPARRRGVLVVISAPSGAGKSTLVHRLIEVLPSLEFSVSATTRPPREGESDGVDYHFLDPAAFERRVATGDFLEHAEVHGNSYGTLRGETVRRLAEGRDVVLDIDVQGARQVRASGEPACLVFILPPNRRELERRLRSRGTDSEASIARRLENAASELEATEVFDHVVLNDRLDEASQTLEAIVRAVRHSRGAMEPIIESVRRTFASGEDGGG